LETSAFYYTGNFNIVTVLIHSVTVYILIFFLLPIHKKLMPVCQLNILLEFIKVLFLSYR